MVEVLKRAITTYRFAAICVFMLWPSVMASATERPNIILILADDKYAEAG